MLLSRYSSIFENPSGQTGNNRLNVGICRRTQILQFVSQLMPIEIDTLPELLAAILSVKWYWHDWPASAQAACIRLREDRFPTQPVVDRHHRIVRFKSSSMGVTCASDCRSS
jgi:hypothetical protein